MFRKIFRGQLPVIHLEILLQVPGFMKRSAGEEKPQPILALITRIGLMIQPV